MKYYRITHIITSSLRRGVSNMIRPFRVGDRVTCNKYGDGRVVYVRENCPTYEYKYLIKFDKGNKRGLHDGCSGEYISDKNDCLWVYEDGKFNKIHVKHAKEENKYGF